MLIALILGGPGAGNVFTVVRTNLSGFVTGKGTQASKLAKEFAFYHISSASLVSLILSHTVS
jgi:hypothetical protein